MILVEFVGWVDFCGDGGGFEVESLEGMFKMGLC